MQIRPLKRSWRSNPLSIALQGLLMAQMRSADCVGQCLSLEAEQKTSARTEYFAFLPKAAIARSRITSQRENQCFDKNSNVTWLKTSGFSLCIPCAAFGITTVAGNSRHFRIHCKRTRTSLDFCPPSSTAPEKSNFLTSSHVLIGRSLSPNAE